MEPYITTLEIAGFASAISAVRLPMKSFDKGDSTIGWGFLRPHARRTNSDAIYLSYCDGEDEVLGLTIGEKDLKLLQKLIRAGEEHAKVMRGIVVWAEINMPRYIWQELDTYTVGVIPLCSESTMHVDAKGLSGEELVEFKDNFTEGHLQKRIRAFSYQTLRRIYFQRKNHRLPQWQIICKWIEGLPLAKELITIAPWWQDRIDELEAKVENLEYELMEVQND